MKFSETKSSYNFNSECPPNKRVDHCISHPTLRREREAISHRRPHLCLSQVAPPATADRTSVCVKSHRQSRRQPPATAPQPSATADRTSVSRKSHRQPPPTQDHPDKKKLFSVQDFYRYTEAEGEMLAQKCFMCFNLNSKYNFQSKIPV
nr:mitochondrial substrate carrier family protein C [Ipomoea batatas]